VVCSSNWSANNWTVAVAAVARWIYLSTSLPKLIPSIKREVEFGFASADCTKSSSLLMSETYKQALTKEVNVLVFRASVSLFIRCLQTEFL
jgi:hypothetical protein